MRSRSIALTVGLIVVALAAATAVVLMRRAAPARDATPSAVTQTGVGAAPPEVSLEIGGNWTSAPTLYRGWPLIVRGVARAAGERNVTLATTGPWSGSVAFQVLQAGATANWTFETTQGATASVELGRLSEAVATWTLAPDFTRSLPPGRYTVSATLDTTGTAVAGGWKGVVSARPMVVQVVDEPAKLNSRDEIWKPLIASQFLRYRRDFPRALATLDAWLAAHPVAVSVLAEKADVLEAMGQSRESLDVVNQAIDESVRQAPHADEPPSGLLRRQQALIAKLLK